MTKGSIYLIPSSLGAENCELELPPANLKIISQIKDFIVENVRTARRFLRSMGYEENFDLVNFYVLDKHTKEEDIPELLKASKDGKDMGILSEAGCPCIADPGQKIVKLAHEQGIRVVPLVGPSSILLALISSGFNGQNFVFHGYLPIDKGERVKKIKEMERDTMKKSQTQIFMETPFRNNALIKDILATCQVDTLFCIASNILSPGEFIQTQSIIQWKQKTPDLHKQPSVFLLYKGK